MPELPHTPDGRQGPKTWLLLSPRLGFLVLPGVISKV